MSKTFTNITVTIGGGVTNNRPVVNGTAIITEGGTNNAVVIGAVVVDGGTNSSTASVTGSVVVNTGSNAASVTGVVRVASGGTQSGAITGSLYVEAGATIAPTTTIASGGNVYAAAGVDAAAVVSNISGFTGSVVQTSNGSLTATAYTGGTAGATSSVTGVFYNLESGADANKAYTYNSDGTKTLLSAPAYNLTGDNRAYTWTSGVKGALYTGAIGSDTYVNGVLVIVAPPSGDFVEFVVSNDTNGGKLYTATGGSVTAGPVYTTSARTTYYTGVFTYSGTTYYASSGTLVGYRPWTVAGNTTTLYTVSTGDVTTDTVYSNSALNVLFTGTFTYSSTDYYATTGTPVAYLTYTVTGDTNAVNSGFLYSLVAFAAGPTDYLYTEPALVNKYTGYYFFEGQGFYAEDGVVNTYRAWTIIGNSAVTVTYTAPDAADITSGNYLVYSDTALQTQYNDFYVYESLTYLPSGGVPALLTGNNFGPNGSMFDYGANGTDNPTGLSLGTYQLVNGGLWYNLDFNGAGTLAIAGVYADATGYYRSFVGDGTATEATGTYEDNGVFYTYSGDGARTTVGDGISAATNGTWYTFANNGIGTLFDGAYYDSTDGYYWPVVSGVVTKTGAYASGRLRQTNSYYYTFDGTGGAGVLFDGAYFDGTSYYSILGSALQMQSYANGIAMLFNDGLYYTFDNTGDAGVLFEGAVYDPVDSYYWPMVNGAITKSTYAGTYVGTILQLLDDGKYYYFYQNGGIGDAITGVVTNYQGLYQDVSNGSLGSLFNGAYSSNNTAFTVENGATTGNPAIGILRDIYNIYRQFSLGTPWNGSPLCDGVLVYGGNYTKFSNGGYIGLFTGAYFASNTYYHINAGILTSDYAPAGILQLSINLAYYTFTGDGTTAVNFDGAYFDGTSYYVVNDGSVTNYYTSAVAQLVNDQKFYKFDGTGGAGVLFDGAASFLSHYFPVNAGALDNSGYANGLLQLADDELYYTFFSADGTKSADPFTGVVGIGDYHYEVAVGVRESAASFTGVYLRASDNAYRVVNNGANTADGPSGMYRFAGDNKYHYFPGNDTLGALFNGAVNIGGSYYSVTDGVREATATFSGAYLNGNVYSYITSGTPGGGAADGILILDSDGLYYKFVNGNKPADPFNGAITIQSSFYTITDGVREATATFNGVTFSPSYPGSNSGTYYSVSSGTASVYAFSGIGKLDSDGLYYKFFEYSKSENTFTGAIQVGSLYYKVTAGVVDMEEYASGIVQLVSDSKYYVFSGDGGPGRLFNGATYSNSQYYVINAGVNGGNLTFDAVLQLADDSKYYRFTNSGLTGTLFTGAFITPDTESGTYFDAIAGNLTDNKSYVVTAGELTNSYADGIIELANDFKYYTFYGDGSAGALFDGAYLNGSGYSRVIAGVKDSTTLAFGIYQFLDDGKYYTFSYTVPVLLPNGGALYNGAWYDIVNGERQSSYFTYGAILTSSGYRTVSSSDGTVTNTVMDNGTIRMLPDGAWYVFINGGNSASVTSETYNTSCDQSTGQGEQLIIVTSGLNMGDRPVQLGATYNGTPTYTVPQIPSKAFVVGGFKYSVDSNGLIDDIYTCSNAYTD